MVKIIDLSKKKILFDEEKQKFYVNLKEIKNEIQSLLLDLKWLIEEEVLIIKYAFLNNPNGSIETGLIFRSMQRVFVTEKKFFLVTAEKSEIICNRFYLTTEELEEDEL